jgi:hypothetical protein
MRAAHPDWSSRSIEDTLANFEQQADGIAARRLPLESHMTSCMICEQGAEGAVPAACMRRL